VSSSLHIRSSGADSHSQGKWKGHPPAGPAAQVACASPPAPPPCRLSSCRQVAVRGQTPEWLAYCVGAPPPSPQATGTCTWHGAACVHVA
jgi:hypothetical protein